MSNYDNSITIIVPSSHVSIAKQVSRALDPDVGGYEAFDQKDEQGNLLLTQTYTTPCTSEFASTVQYVLAQGGAYLAALVAADYSARWPELTPPSVAECEEFVSVVQITYG